MSEINFQEQIDKIPYRSVQEAVLEYFKEWARGHKTTVAFLLGAFLVLIFSILKTSLSAEYLIFPGVFVVLVYAVFSLRGEERFYRAVAKAWGWEFFPARLHQDFPSSFLKYGKGASAVYVLRSPTLPVVEVATLFYYLGSGKSKQYFRKTAVRVDLEFPVAGLVLMDSDASLGAQLLSWYPEMEELRVGTLKDTGRKLYVERELEIEALQVFSDDRLVKVVAQTKKFTVEFNDTDVYVYSSLSIKTRGDLKQLLEISQLVIDELVPKLKQISSSTRAMQQAKADKGV